MNFETNYHTPKLVLVDKQYKAVCQIGDMGTFSDRFLLAFIEPHPKWGNQFMTKHFQFVDVNTVRWGYENRVFNLEIIEDTDGLVEKYGGKFPVRFIFQYDSIPKNLQPQLYCAPVTNVEDVFCFT
ncbi:unnamed protein product [Didymodactylos carnosus]|uniref:Uncharacterized protein n=1 Tax=Didymodactylos carnosus TaxID=1234261 RepID=A0A815N2L5_9BILA|nr:unnamed protein product [Didymodactylos carnosus]CAF1432515.1 unnamed protein product [Didymodactylos carnosus]CAF4104062.1 unnamed protein product [Didymodactylos carnosus]CAF4310788.1 unnamed protein product [Didymodactylos carnosus]